MTHTSPPLTTEQVYADDADAVLERTITARDNDLTFTPMVAVDGGTYDITATWFGAEGKERVIRVPIPTGLTPGMHSFQLDVPDGTNRSLGQVEVVERS